MTTTADAYAVDGYGQGARNPQYDGPYLDGHSFDPNVQFAFAGDPEKAAQLQKIIDETDGQPVLANGVVTIVTGPDEPNVVILSSEPADTKTIVLEKSAVDEANEEAGLHGGIDIDPLNENGTKDEDSDPKADEDNAEGDQEHREGAPYVTPARDSVTDGVIPVEDKAEKVSAPVVASAEGVDDNKENEFKLS